MISPKEIAKREKEAWIREKKYQHAQYRRKEIIKGIERGLCGFNFTCFQTPEEAIADLENIEVIMLRTQVDGIYPNSEVFHQDYTNTLLKAPIITIDNICAKLHDKLCKEKPYYQKACWPQKDYWSLIEEWLNECRETPDPEILRLQDKDLPTTSYKWSIEYQLKDKEESDNVESRATSRG